jgi:hypothetical protein
VDLLVVEMALVRGPVDGVVAVGEELGARGVLVGGDGDGDGVGVGEADGF